MSTKFFGEQKNFIGGVEEWGNGGVCGAGLENDTRICLRLRRSRLARRARPTKGKYPVFSTQQTVFSELRGVFIGSSIIGPTGHSAIRPSECNAALRPNQMPRCPVAQLLGWMMLGVLPRTSSTPQGCFRFLERGEWEKWEGGCAEYSPRRLAATPLSEGGILWNLVRGRAARAPRGPTSPKTESHISNFKTASGLQQGGRNFAATAAMTSLRR